MSFKQAAGMRRNLFVNQRALRGFTLVELVAVLAVIGVLLVMAIPSVAGRVTREQVNESLDLIKLHKQKLADHYLALHEFPANYLDAGFPKPDKWIGNYVERIDYNKGAFTLQFGQKVHTKLAHKKLSIRPLVVIDSADSPISWVCGNAKVPQGMLAIGANETNIETAYLPYGCF